MIALVVTCRVCDRDHTPDRTAILQGDWHICSPCRTAIRDHAIQAMHRDGYAPPRADHPDHDTQLARWDTCWRAHLATAERFLTRVHDLERETPDDAA